MTRKVYLLTMRMMNGTVTLSSTTSLFSTEQLAQKTLDRLKKLNSDLNDKILYSITETELFESEDDVPVLNDWEYDKDDNIVK